MNGADILLESLKKEGVEIIFGYPGGVLLGFYDRLYDNSIKHILPRHEQGGIHAAEGYAKVTGKVGVCFATSGPGATNLVTGIADAHMDSIPLVVFTGQVSTSLIGRDAFQEADIVGITRPIVKHSYLVKDVQRLPEVVKEAFHIALTGRPGPVLIDLPKDVLNTTYKGKFTYPNNVDIQGYQPNYHGHPMQIKKLLHSVENAKRPILLVGGGIVSSRAAEELLKFAEATEIPVITTFMGRGVFPENHPLYIGWLGMHGNYASNMAIVNSDYIVAVGTRFSDRSTGDTKKFAPNAKVAQIDIDPTSIGKNIPVDLPIVGDSKVVLEQLLNHIKEYKKEKNKVSRNDWLQIIKQWDNKYPFEYEKSNSIIMPQFVIEQISKVTHGDAVIVTEVGQHQMWTGQYYKFTSPYQFVSSAGLGTMGFGLPAAIGAKIGKPNKEVFNIAGDGSILMNIQEIATAVQYKLGVKIAIINNSFLGMVRQWQEMFYNRRYSESELDFQPDFVTLAKSFGAIGFKIDKPSEVEAVLKESLKIKDTPVLMDFKCAKEENVYPIVPAGAGLNEMIIKPGITSEKQSKAV